MPDLEDRLRAALTDRYRIEREVGRGGMAVVYLAHDLRHDRHVAIKVLSPEVGEALGPERFLREIALTAQLTHPSILPVYDSGEAGGVFFYVMPFVAGESLKQRLAREGPLPLDEAFRIALAVADALSQAHAHGIVHRDIKPANILLEAGHAVVSDFGIAKALIAAGEERLTATGIAIGTVGYMSPEQATGQAHVDQRSDIYGLGCVLYEMLAGETPFTGPSAQAVIAKQLSTPVPDVGVVRETVPVPVSAVINRCLAKAPADRYQTAAEFAGALDAAKSDPHPRLRRPHVRVSTKALAVGSVAVLAAVAAAAGLTRGFGRLGTDRDTTLYAIEPFTYDALAPPLNEDERLRDALGRWTGLTVALRPGDRTAGRRIRGSVSQVDGALRVHAALYDAGAGQPLADHAVRVPINGTGADSLVQELADHLLTRGHVADARGEAWGTRSLPAFQAFQEGMGQLERWDLTAADSAFATAVRFDAVFAQAHLWTAVVRLWRDQDPAQWRVDAEQAVIGAGALGGRVGALAEAVAAEARRDYEVACPRWAAVVDEDPEWYAGWYGLARCLLRDARVVEDRASPSGWRFRTSYHYGLEAFERAFARRPAVLAGFRDRSYAELRHAFMVGNEQRLGFGPGGAAEQFVADAAWIGDTLALVPFPRDTSGLRPLPPSTREAQRHQRERLRAVALTWVTSDPANPAALEALAVALSMLGDPAARDTLAHARRVAATPVERFRIASAQVWMGLAFALPWDADGVRGAAALADSLLDGRVAGAEPDPALLPGLAALRGRAADAARYARTPEVTGAMLIPAALRETAPALLVYAALGAPADSVRALAARTAAAIDELLLPAERDMVRMTVLARAATLAFPNVVLPEAETLTARGDYLLDMQLAWRRGDTAAVRDRFDDILAARRNLPAAAVSLDGLYAEAQLLVAMGEMEMAADWLDPALRSQYLVAPADLGSPVRAAVLVPTLALRTTIAQALDDRALVEGWAGSALLLWKKTD